MEESTIRNRFKELCDHLKTKKVNLGINLEQFDSEVEEMTVGQGGGNETCQGWHFANFRYRGMIYIERLPVSSLALLALLVRAWLDEHDDTRDKYNLPQPEISTVPLDGGYIDVMLETELIDEVFLVESETGLIEWRGAKYDLGIYPVEVAEAGTVNEAPLYE